MCNNKGRSNFDYFTTMQKNKVCFSFPKQAESIIFSTLLRFPKGQNLWMIKWLPSHLYPLSVFQIWHGHCSRPDFTSFLFPKQSLLYKQVERCSHCYTVCPEEEKNNHRIRQDFPKDSMAAMVVMQQMKFPSLCHSTLKSTLNSPKLAVNNLTSLTPFPHPTDIYFPHKLITVQTLCSDMSIHTSLFLYYLSWL